ncbi:hypothetical protein HAX54_043916 [Datura stramonium]|uniref:Uncharacterized protein n=1 Tax=Datura stramonium TaxID=4076 RepID=A0ABS8W1T0_DATST|nr:hypothetical protein [Datura stramonium]
MPDKANKDSSSSDYHMSKHQMMFYEETVFDSALARLFDDCGLKRIRRYLIVGSASNLIKSCPFRPYSPNGQRAGSKAPASRRKFRVRVCLIPYAVSSLKMPNQEGCATMPDGQEARRAVKENVVRSLLFSPIGKSPIPLLRFPMTQYNAHLTVAASLKEGMNLGKKSQDSSISPLAGDMTSS